MSFNNSTQFSFNSCTDNDATSTNIEIENKFPDRIKLTALRRLPALYASHHQSAQLNISTTNDSQVGNQIKTDMEWEAEYNTKESCGFSGIEGLVYKPKGHEIYRTSEQIQESSDSETDDSVDEDIYNDMLYSYKMPDLLEPLSSDEEVDDIISLMEDKCLF
ncbi:hypothetical protein GWI33_012167 [Rhynchophorus ferrugineus]|uniref:Uncharacterized protein n=1 Tax=Rhynchophorus ferrugineus TaxID=354439 RepID=A0A834IAJ6_RHYFE|nr:hypothetical protein GWI33_012167 [Rhynchophorus ferrugineus]